MSAWVLPDHIADVLPSEARHIEELRRELLDAARGYGYELVMPPLLEHLESLLTGTGEALDLLTFKLVDQLSGRTLGLRADSTPQVARIDAHLLNRRGVARLCYCGPVLHTRPERPHATREPLQFGAEIYGHAGREADLEALELALDCLRAAKLASYTVDLADVRIVSALLDGSGADAETQEQIQTALAAKDVPELTRLTQGMPAASRKGLPRQASMQVDARVLNRIFLGEHTEYVVENESLGAFTVMQPHQAGASELYEIGDRVAVGDTGGDRGDAGRRQRG